MIAFSFTVHPERATDAKIAVSTALDHSSNFYRKRTRRIEMLNDSGPQASEGGPASIQLLEQGTGSQFSGLSNENSPLNLIFPLHSRLTHLLPSSIG